jgi:hypothetical protein
MLRRIVWTKEDYSLKEFVWLPDARAEALTFFKDVELHAPTFFASYSVVCIRYIYEDIPSMCARCLRWNLKAPFM